MLDFGMGNRYYNSISSSVRVYLSVGHSTYSSKTKEATVLTFLQMIEDIVRIAGKLLGDPRPKVKVSFAVKFNMKKSKCSKLSKKP